MDKILNNSIHLFALLAMIFIPAATYVIPYQDALAVWVFGDIVEAFGIPHLDFSSDTLALNVLLLLLLAVAIGIASVIHFTKSAGEKMEQFIRFIRLMIVFYLASRLMVYGFDKVFKTQFYLPEPNTLYTPLGYLSKDILFWSAMGTSKWYCILSGVMEIIPALMLLWRKTRLAGLILTLLLLSHVLVINIGFDISVKLYTLFLMFLCLVVLFPNLQVLFQFFFKGDEVKLIKEKISYKPLYQPHLKSMFKAFAIGIIFVDALQFPISTGAWNDDNGPRPYLHGAYEVVGYVDKYKNPIEPPTNLRRFFFHRRGFLIYQYWDDRMVDYQIEDRPTALYFMRTDYKGVRSERNYYETETGIFRIEDNINGTYCWIEGRALDWRKMPALQDEFHWVVDGVGG